MIARIRTAWRPEHLIMGLAVVALAVLIAYPIGLLLLRSFTNDGAWSLASYTAALTQNANYLALGRSLFVSLTATLFATVIGTLLAWVVARTDLPFKRWVGAGLMLPYLIPPFIGAIAWVQLLGPAGYLNKLYMFATGSAEPLFSIYGPVGIILVMTLHSFPLVYLTAVGPLGQMDPALEEAARMSGASRFQVLRRVTLPVMSPVIGAGAMIVFVTEVANFGVPAILGYSVNYHVLTTRIYALLTSLSGGDRLASASALSMLLVAAAAAGLLAQHWLLKGRKFTVLTGKSNQPGLVSLGSLRYPILAATMLFIGLTAAAPLVAVTLTAITKAWGLSPTPSNWTLDNFRYVLTQEAMHRSAVNSLLLAFGAATGALILGALIAYIVKRTTFIGRHLLDLVATMPYALPGTVVALAMILAWLKPVPILGIHLYNTIWILLVAYIARYLAFAVRTASASLEQIHDSMEEAARMSGARWVGTFRRIVVPLMRPGLVSGWLLIFMPSLRELTLSVLLWSVGNETIGVMVFNLQEAGDITSTSALALLMIVVVFAGHQLTEYLTRRQTQEEGVIHG